MLFQPRSEQPCKLCNRNDLKKKNYVIDPHWICRWSVQVKHFMEKKPLTGNGVKSKNEDRFYCCHFERFFLKESKYWPTSHYIKRSQTLYITKRKQVPSQKPVFAKMFHIWTNSVWMVVCCIRPKSGCWDLEMKLICLIYYM